MINCNKNKEILVVSQYYYPEQFRINDLCSEWVNRGYKVTVLTGIPNYPEGSFYPGYGFFKRRREVVNGVSIIRIPIIPRRNSSLFLVLNYLSFVISGFFWQLFTKIKADSVFIFEVSPITQALPAVWYAKKRNIPCCIYVQDLWPENVQIMTGIKSPKIISSIGRIVDYIYSNCTKILTTSKSFINAIKARSIDESKIEFWPQYAEELYRPLPRKSIKEINNSIDFNLIFTGNIGRAQGLEVFPEAAKILSEKRPDLKYCFNLVGDGRYKEELKTICQSLEVSEKFNFIPKQPASQIPKLLAASDIALLPLSNNPLFEMTIPAKLQSYMACGMPIIASAKGEVEQIISEANAGICCQPGDASGLADAIVKMSNMLDEELKELGANSRRYSEQYFQREYLLDYIDSYFMGSISDSTTIE